MSKQSQEVFLWTNTWNQYFATLAGFFKTKLITNYLMVDNFFSYFFVADLIILSQGTVEELK